MVKRIAALWSEMTDQSGKTQEEILSLVEKARSGIGAFSQTGNEGLQKARMETRVGLENLRTAAAFASKQATKIETMIGGFQAQIAAVGSTGDSLDACFAHIDKVLSELETLRRHFESDPPKALSNGDQAEMEAMFSGLYTTEMEREVLRAALKGAPLPVMQQNLTGNDVELF